MGTLHANSPREALSRMESMISMGGFSLPARTIREMIATSVDIVVQTQRLRDGSRRITHITEVIGMEGEVVTTQDIFVFEILGEDAHGRIIGRHRGGTGVGGGVRALRAPAGAEDQGAHQEGDEQDGGRARPPGHVGDGAGLRSAGRSRPGHPRPTLRQPGDRLVDGRS